MNTEEQKKSVTDLKNKLFEKTGLKFDDTDPVLQLYLLQDHLMQDRVMMFQKNLNDIADAIITDISEQQSLVLSGFDKKTEALNKLLTALENQKEAIVADVWQKLDKRVAEKVRTQLSEDMKAIASNANNRINNQRNMLLGAVAGATIGLFIGLLIMFMLHK